MEKKELQEYYEHQRHIEEEVLRGAQVLIEAIDANGGSAQLVTWDNRGCLIAPREVSHAWDLFLCSLRGLLD